jgi:hypothetical protein
MLSDVEVDGRDVMKKEKHEATIFITVGQCVQAPTFFDSATYCCDNTCCMTGDSHCFSEEEDDTTHMASISGSDHIDIA